MEELQIELIDFGASMFSEVYKWKVMNPGNRLLLVLIKPGIIQCFYSLTVVHAQWGRHLVKKGKLCTNYCSFNKTHGQILSKTNITTFSAQLDGHTLLKMNKKVIILNHQRHYYTSVASLCKIFQKNLDFLSDGGVAL